MLCELLRFWPLIVVWLASEDVAYFGVVWWERKKKIRRIPAGKMRPTGGRA